MTFESFKCLASIVIPTYNRAYCLKRAIYSVLTQDFDDYEIIIIDNYSSDNTKELVQSIQDSRIIFKEINNNTPPPIITRNGNRFSFVIFLI